MQGMAGVNALLGAMKLEQYCDAFEAEGYDDAAYLAGEMSEEQLGLIGEQTRMKTGHAQKLRSMLLRVREQTGIAR
mgnify:CR=1 FL=1